jgi:hydrogenase maturation protease
MWPEVPSRLLILGLGNVLCQDDGLGALAVGLLLREYEPPSGVQVLDGGTLGLALLPLLEAASQVILVDAIRDEGRPPGSLVRLSGEEVAPAAAARLSPHQVGVADLLEGARWRERLPARLVLLGLVPKDLGLGLGLSPAVAAALPGLLACVVEEARALGQPLVERRDHVETLPRSARDFAGLCGL